MKPVGGDQIPWSEKRFYLILIDNHWLQRKISNVSSYIYPFLLDHFYAHLVAIMQILCKIRSSEKLLTNAFGHNVEQPSPWFDVIRKLRWPIVTFAYPWHCLMTMYRDQFTFICVWHLLVWNGSSKESQQQEWIYDKNMYPNSFSGFFCLVTQAQCQHPSKANRGPRLIL